MTNPTQAEIEAAFVERIATALQYCSYIHPSEHESMMRFIRTHISQPEQQEAVGIAPEKQFDGKTFRLVGGVYGSLEDVGITVIDMSYPMTATKPAGWRTIDSAPKKLGEPVFLLIDGYTYNSWAIGSRWVKYPTGEDWELSVKPLNVTHWMPRPPAPPAEDGEA